MITELLILILFVIRLLRWVTRYYNNWTCIFWIYVVEILITFLTVWLTGLFPFAIVMSIILLGICCIFIPLYEHKLFTKTFLIPWPIIIGVSLVYFVPQVETPDPGELVVEDRKDWHPPTPETKIGKLLSAPWATDDLHADWPAISIMAKLCNIAYKDPVDARVELNSLGFQSETISSGSMNGYVLNIDDSVVIIFRGTESSLFDILQDLYFLEHTTDHGDLHGGFHAGYIGMHGQVKKLLERYNPKRIWITGHSLGGALSVVCAYQLMQDNKYPIAGVMTFGQPMVVHSNMSKYITSMLENRYVHFVNNLDPIVNVVRPYVHFGHLVWLKGDDIFRSKKNKIMMSNLVRAQEKSPSLKSMTPEEFREFIKREKQNGMGQFAPDGRPLVQGNWSERHDHYLKSYLRMADILTGKDPHNP